MRGCPNRLTVVGLALILAACPLHASLAEDSRGDDAVHALLARGIAGLEDGDLTVAENSFRGIIDRYPEEPLGYANLGLTAVRLNNYADAEAQLAEALKRAPNATPILWLHAKAAYRAGQTPVAIDRLRTAIASDPDDIRVRYELAFLLSLDEATAPEAALHMTRIVESRPRNFAARMEHLKFLAVTQDATATRAAFDATVALVSDYGRAAQFVEQIPAALDAGDWRSATRFLMAFQNVLRATDRFRSDLKHLKGPDDEQIGIPLTEFLAIPKMELPRPKPKAMRFTARQLPMGDVAGPVLFATDVNRDGKKDLVGYTGETFAVVTPDARPANVKPGESVKATLLADLNNDRILDLIAGGNGEIRVWYGTRDGYETHAHRVAVDSASGEIRALAAVDFDHDGDLDLYGAASAGVEFILRNGNDGTWVDVTGSLSLFWGEGSVDDDSTFLTFADFDDDGDTDLVTSSPSRPLRFYDNVRQMQLDDIAGAVGLGNVTRSGPIDSGDIDNDGDIDLVMAGLDGMPLITVFKQVSRGRFEIAHEIEPASEMVYVEALKLADVDNDGWLDLVYSSYDVSQILRNDQHGDWKDAIPVEGTWRADRIEAADYDGDYDLDLLVSAPGAGEGFESWLLLNEGGNQNHAVAVEAVGLRQESIINNAFGIGGDLQVAAGRLWLKRTLKEPWTLVGIGEQPKADIVRVLFSNGVPINVFDPPIDAQVNVVQVPKGSCPWVFAWNGERFEVVTDILTESGLGLRAGDHFTAPVDPDQTIAISGNQLVPRGDRVEIRITEELGESVYADEVRLLAVDHPSAIEILPNEGHGMPPFPDWRIIQIPERLPPRHAVDMNGNDILDRVSREDGVYWGDFRKNDYLGIAHEHWVELDFGDCADAESLTLFVSGWNWWFDTSIMVADSQNSRTELMLPKLEAWIGGEWRVAHPFMRFPPGQPKTAVVELDGLVDPADVRLRVTSTMFNYWDQFYLSKGGPERDIRTTSAPLLSAHLHYRGYSEIVISGTSTPYQIDYDRVSHEPKWRPLVGRYTRYGEVGDLLAAPDNQLATMNTGDELALSFDAAALPELPEGWARTWLFTVVGWDKDLDLNTTASATLEPFPWHGMDHNTYGSAAPPDDVRAAHEAAAGYQTREVGDEAFRTWIRYYERPAAHAR